MLAPPLERTEGKRVIPGTPVFDSAAARRGYAINAMCYSFNTQENRDAFVADEEGYMARFELTEQQKQAVRDRNVLAMLDAGGNVYYLAKLAGIFGLNVQDIGSMQTGKSLDQFKADLLAQGETTRRNAS
jgi:protocatechuate 4,5-dioxygenase, alpha chain